MRISINEEEFEAISFAEDFINTALESADDDFVRDASVHCNCLLSLIDKIRTARAKDRELANFYRLAKKMYPDHNPGAWKKMARKALNIQKSNPDSQQ